MQTYFHYVRQCCDPKEGVGSLLFLTANGGRYTQVYLKMQEAFSDTKIEIFGFSHHYSIEY